MGVTAVMSDIGIFVFSIGVYGVGTILWAKMVFHMLEFFDNLK